MSLRDDILTRVEQLRCLAGFQKRSLLRFLSQYGEDAESLAFLEVYVRDHLSILEQYIEPIVEENADFAAKCQQFAKCQTPSELVRLWGLSVPEQFEFDTWLEWSYQLQMDDIPSLLLCAATISHCRLETCPQMGGRSRCIKPPTR